MTNWQEEAIKQEKSHRMVRLEDLDRLPAPPTLGPRHVPIPHGELVRGLTVACLEHGLTVEGNDISLGGSFKDKKRADTVHVDTDVCGTLTLRNGEALEGSSMQLGFWSSNAFRKAVHVVAGRHVMVCNNLQIWGDAILVHKKHTRGFNLSADLGEAIRRFIAVQHEASAQIERLAACEPSTERIRSFLYAVWARKVVPGVTCRKVHELYFRDALRTPEAVPEIVEHHGSALGLHHAFTRALREFPMHVKLKHTSAIEVPFRSFS